MYMMAHRTLKHCENLLNLSFTSIFFYDYIIIMNIM